jgi:hypothetical protein
MTDDERILRQLVASGHGHQVYWDDGEMSDASMFPNIDFKRDAPIDIRTKIWERNRIRWANMSPEEKAKITG